MDYRQSGEKPACAGMTNKARMTEKKRWIPACAGMTKGNGMTKGDEMTEGTG